MDSAYSLARNIEIFHICGHAVYIDIETAVLIMERGINKYRLLADIYAVACKHTHHRGDSAFYRALAADSFYHRRIEPNSLTAACIDTFAAVGTFADYGSRRNIARLKRMHEYLAVAVYELRTERTHLFRYERAENLLGISRACRMILERIGIEQFCAYAIAENKSVGCSAVMVRCREALIMHSSRAACSDDDRLCAGNHQLMRFHIHENRTCRLAVFIEYKLYCRREINNGNITVEHLVAQCSHYLGTGIVLCRMHTLTRSTAAVSCYHCAVGRLVKFHAEVVKPFYSLGRIADELREQFALCRIVTAAESIDKMDSGRIIGLISRLNAALCHHRIGVAYAQLCDNHRLCAGIIRLYRRGSTCAATADDEYIDIICDIREVYILRLYAAVRLKHFAKLMRNSLALICTDSESCKFALLIVGMISRKKRFFLIRCHAGRLICDIFFSCGFDSGKRFLKFL